LDWYQRNSRQLPWRGAVDAYATLVSEVMLQQTRVETVIPYYTRWMERFPTLADLAAASEQDVLRVWEGLGYYRRARNLHAAAAAIVARHGGKVPADLKALQSLPGIGRYSATAIASIAYGADAAALDGNIKRVLARIHDVSEPVDTPAGMRRLWRLAEQHLPPGRAGDYNQALMDLGATVCLPRDPHCPLCPLKNHCLVRTLDLQDARPVRSEKKQIPHYTVVSAVIRRRGRYLLARRPAASLMGGLWEFPGGKVEPGESLVEALQREIREELAAGIHVGAEFGVYLHRLTHFSFTLHAFCCTPGGEAFTPLEADELAWVKPADMNRHPMGKIDRLIARKLVADHGG
jgi:A/G-specific adenine glycosylase